MNATINKMAKIKESQNKCTEIIDKIIADKQYHKPELLQPVIDAMEELIQLAERKLAK